MMTHNNATDTPTPWLRQIAAWPALQRAWLKVRANRGAAGVDAVSLQAFSRDLSQNLQELSRNLLNRTYQPLPARPVAIPKNDGSERALAIPAVRDRVAQRSALDAIEPLFEPQFLDCSYAFRPGRSVEMAVQQILVARAQGLLWTVEADIRDFFPSLDNRILLEEVARTVKDADLLRLLRLWLEAGVLRQAQETGGDASWGNWLAGAQMYASEAAQSLVHDFLSSQLGETSLPEAYDETEFDLAPPPAEPVAAPNHRRAVVRRLLKDGALLALAERATLSRLLGVKALGLGGAALALAAVAPPLARQVRACLARPAGAPQGAPVSPLLSNIYLHPFDVALTAPGFRLIRYCDDFVILCRDQAHAVAALSLAENTLRARHLRLRSDKTRVASPSDSFSFLGYGFLPGGRIIPPPNIPAVVSRRVVAFARHATQQATRQAFSIKEQAATLWRGRGSE